MNELNARGQHKICHFKLKVKELLENVESDSPKEPHSLLLYKYYKFNDNIPPENYE
jgi:hypothetical protein